MLWRDIVDLVSTTYTENGMGDSIEIETSKTIYANKKSIRQSEFYQAAMTNLQPELMFEVRSIDYEAEKKLAYDNKMYDIIRVFTKNDEIIELTCQGVI